MRHAEIDEHDTERYYKDGKLHRENGPAIIFSNGDTCWFLDGELHRIGGPAREMNETKEWYVEGDLHREDGPAIEWFDGTKSWMLRGYQLTKNEFNNPEIRLRLAKLNELTPEQVAETDLFMFAQRLDRLDDEDKGN